MTAKLYLFTYKPVKPGWTDHCINAHMESLYDIKHVHDRVYLIKTDDDIDLLEKYLVECFNKQDSFFLLQIKDEPYRHQKLQSSYINRWMEDI